MKRRVGVVACVAAIVFGMSPAMVGTASTEPITTAKVKAGGISVSYPARWVNLLVGAPNLKRAVKLAQKDNPKLTESDVLRLLLGAGPDSVFFAIDLRTGDYVNVKLHAFDLPDSTVDQFQSTLQTEAKRLGASGTLTVVATTVDSQRAFRADGVNGSTRVASLYLAHPTTGHMVAITAASADNSKGTRVVNSIVQGVHIA